MMENSRLEEDASHNKEEEQWLVQAVKDGDKEAFQILVKRYQRQVHAHCLRMVNDPEEANDLSQEVFFKVFRYIKKYEHSYAFYTWLYRITVNTCIDHLRKKKRQPVSVSLSNRGGDDSSGLGKEMDIADSTFMPDTTLANKEMAQVLRQSISQLSTKLRSIIILKEVEGFSYDEIAVILNCSRGTVKSRLFRARERLKELLAPYMDQVNLT